MLKYPYPETPLTEREKNAYRYLLYQAMVDIRNLCRSYNAVSLNPLEWRRQYRDSRVAGELAEWLHNMAYFASMDFKGFNAERHWEVYDYIVRRSMQIGPGRYLDYRHKYEHWLALHDEEQP